MSKNEGFLSLFGRLRSTKIPYLCNILLTTGKMYFQEVFQIQ